MQWDLRLFVSKLQKIEVATDRRADIIRINVLYWNLHLVFDIFDMPFEHPVTPLVTEVHNGVKTFMTEESGCWRLTRYLHYYFISWGKSLPIKQADCEMSRNKPLVDISPQRRRGSGCSVTGNIIIRQKQKCCRWCIFCRFAVVQNVEGLLFIAPSKC